MINAARKAYNKFASKSMTSQGLELMKPQGQVPINLNEYATPIVLWDWDHLSLELFDILQAFKRYMMWSNHLKLLAKKLSIVWWLGMPLIISNQMGFAFPCLSTNLSWLNLTSTTCMFSFQ